MPEEKPHSGTRRRGAALDDALLTAAWDQLVAGGYGNFTVEAVAERARTSRPVVYRRWPHRSDLAVAAIRHHGELDPVTVPDTGTLRGDLLAYLLEVSTKRAEMAAVFSLHMGQWFNETGSSPRDVHRQMLAGRPSGIDVIYERAARRGELDPARLTPRVAQLPLDLMRHELLTTLRPIPEETVAEILDDIFLPLVHKAD